MKGLGRTWKDRERLEKIWEDLKGPERTWKDLKEFENKLWQSVIIRQTIKTSRQTDNASAREACTSKKHNSLGP